MYTIRRKNGFMKTMESNGKVSIYPDDVILKSGMPKGTFRIHFDNMNKQLSSVGRRI